MDSNLSPSALGTATHPIEKALMIATELDRISRHLNREQVLYADSGLLERIKQDPHYQAWAYGYNTCGLLPVTPKQRTLKGSSGFDKFFKPKHR